MVFEPSWSKKCWLRSISAADVAIIPLLVTQNPTDVNPDIVIAGTRVSLYSRLVSFASDTFNSELLQFVECRYFNSCNEF